MNKATDNHLFVIFAKTLILIFIQKLNVSELLHESGFYRSIQTRADPFHGQGKTSSIN